MLRLSVLDGLGNAGVDWAGEVELVAQPEGLAVPRRVDLTEADHGTKAIELVPERPGVYRLLARAVLGEEDALAQSNPMLVENGVARVRWADLHGHSNLSDGTGTPEEFLTYARDVAGPGRRRAHRPRPLGRALPSTSTRSCGRGSSGRPSASTSRGAS